MLLLRDIPVLNITVRFASSIHSLPSTIFAFSHYRTLSLSTNNTTSIPPPAPATPTMFFPASALLYAAFLALTNLVAHTHAADCSTGPFAFIWQIGETDPSESKHMSPFCSSLWDIGVPVAGLDVWYDEREGINELQIQYANGDRHGIFGVPGSSPQHQSIDWEYSKTFVDSFSLWGNGGGAKLGNIRMVLTDGREVDVGNRHDTRSKKTEFPVDVGAGVMLGFGGWGGDDIKQGYALFLRSQIDHITMTDPVFDDSPENLNAQQNYVRCGWPVAMKPAPRGLGGAPWNE